MSSLETGDERWQGLNPFCRQMQVMCVTEQLHDQKQKWQKEEMEDNVEWARCKWQIEVYNDMTSFPCVGFDGPPVTIRGQ